MASYELFLDKETDRKYRWIGDVDGVAFKFYIPQICAPQPETITVSIHPDEASAAAVRANIKATVAFVREHSETVQYAPIGDPKE